MSYNYISAPSPNFTPASRKPAGITIHWWGDPAQKPSFDGVVAWLRNPKSQVSAHFVITGTGRKVAHLVEESNIAWHARAGNTTTIGLELDPRCRAEDYDVAAEVIAALRKKFGNLPLYRHSHWVATQCPGNYDINKLDSLAKLKAQGATEVNKIDAEAVRLAYQLDGRTADKTAQTLHSTKGTAVSMLKGLIADSPKHGDRKIINDQKAQIAKLNTALIAANKALENEKNKPPEVVIKEVEKIVEKVVEVPVEVGEQEALKRFIARLIDKLMFWNRSK